MRLKNIILTKLIHDRLLYYEKLEREMNSTNDVESQTKDIELYLKKINSLDGMIKIWEGIVENDTIMENVGKNDDEKK